MSTYCYEARSILRGGAGNEDSDGEILERYDTPNSAILGTLEYWGDDTEHDVLLFQIEIDDSYEQETRTYIGSILHDDSDSELAVVCCPLGMGKPELKTYRCQLVDICGRFHTNIILV